MSAVVINNLSLLVANDNAAFLADVAVYDRIADIVRRFGFLKIFFHIIEVQFQ